MNCTCGKPLENKEKRAF